MNNDAINHNIQTIFTPLCTSLSQYLAAISGQELTPSIAQKIQDITKHDIAPAIKNIIHDITFPNNCYTRQAINYEQSTPYEIVVSLWSPNSFTPIHGHPQLASYYTLQGEFYMELYEHVGDNNENALSYTGDICLKKGEGHYYIGDAGRYDNFIHRVYANDYNIGLHVFSELASLGEKF